MRAYLGLLLVTALPAGAPSQSSPTVRAPTHIRIINTWDRLGEPPVLRLTLVTETRYPDTGYCLRTESRQQLDTLTIRLLGVDHCEALVGHTISPASWSMHLPYDSLGRSMAVRIVVDDVVDTYTLFWGPSWARFTADEAPRVTVLDYGEMVQLIPPESLFVGCVTVLLSEGACNALYRVLQQRLGRDEMPYSRAFDVLAYKQQVDRSRPPPENAGIGLVGITATDLDSVLALARTFTNLMQGGSRDNPRRGFTQVRVTTWLGRQYFCTEGTCAGNR